MGKTKLRTNNLPNRIIVNDREIYDKTDRIIVHDREIYDKTYSRLDISNIQGDRKCVRDNESSTYRKRD